MTTMQIYTVAALLTAAVLVMYAVAVYNGLVQLRNNIEKAWKNIDVLLVQRHDELTGLVEVVKAYAAHERETLAAVTRLRGMYQRARNIEEKVMAENRINAGLASINAVAEGYPDIKADAQFMRLQERMTFLESSISDRREFFNDSVTIYNIRVERFPENVFAAMFGFNRHRLLEVPGHKKVVPAYSQTQQANGG